MAGKGLFVRARHHLGGVGRMLMLLLVWGGLPAGLAPMAAAAASAPKVATPGAVPAVATSAEASSPATQTVVETPPGGFHGEKVVQELVDRRTPASRSYVMAGGGLGTFEWPAPIEYRDASATWHLIDPSLQATPGGGWHNAGDAASVQLPASLSSPISVTTPSGTVTYRLDGASATGTVSGTTVTYASALPGVDVSYQSKVGFLKEDLALSGPSAQRRFSFSVTVPDGASIVSGSVHNLNVVDASGAFIVGLSPPVMVDAAGVRSRGVALSASQQGGAWSISLVPDATWLDAPGRAWPVVVDPDVTFSGHGPGPGSGEPKYADTYIASNETTGDDYSGSASLQVGVSSGQLFRALIQFPDLAGNFLSDSKVTDAKLWVTQTAHTTSNADSISVYPVTTSWYGPNWDTFNGVDYWNNAGGDYSTSTVDTEPGGTSNTQWTFYPRAAVQSIVNYASPNDGFELVANESVTNLMTFTSWDGSSLNGPSLYVEYTPTSGLAPGQTFISHKINDHQTLKVDANGNLVITANDYSVAGVGLNFSVGRTYSSRPNLAGAGADRFGGDWDIRGGPSTELDYLNDNGVDRGVNFEGPAGTDDLFVPVTGTTSPRCPQYPSDANRTRYVAPPGADADLCYDASSDTFSLINHASQETLRFAGNLASDNKDYQLVSDTDRNGHAITYGYDASGNWTGVTDTVGRAFTVTVDGHGRVTNIAEANFSGAASSSTARSVTYTYDTDDPYYLKTFTDASNHTTTYHHDAYHRLDQITDSLGNEISLAYDSYARVTSMTYVTNTATGDGVTTTMTYDQNLAPKLWGDFETSTVLGWSNTSGSSLATTTTAHLDGAYALAATATGGAMEFATPAGTAGIRVAPGQQYIDEAYIKAATTGSSVIASILWYNVTGTYLSSSSSASGSGWDVSSRWNQIGISGTAPANAAYAAIDLIYQSPATASVHYVDDAGLFLYPGDGTTPCCYHYPVWNDGLAYPLLLPATLIEDAGDIFGEHVGNTSPTFLRVIG